MKHPAKTDIAVLMLFFNRPDSFRQVFEEVRKARPSRLFLYQDGPRGAQDMEGIMACRQIAEQVDWECDVRRNYQQHNQGCDPSGYLSHKWAFSLADKVMVLEDDVVPSQSFFPFCKEMLDRYEHDQRVGMIAGFNVDEVTPDVPYDYFFTTAFSIWGWASWRRVVDRWDGSYAFMDDAFAMRQLRDMAAKQRLRPDFLRMCAHHKASGKPYFESIFWSTMVMNSMLAVMPSRNMISNVGAMLDSTHFSTSLSTMPRRLRRIFTMQRHELSYPLHHPHHVVEYTPYKERLYLVNAWGHPWRKVAYSMEELWLNLRRGQFAAIRTAAGRRLSKWMGYHRHQ